MIRPLRVLSVRQPFATALFGPKPGENRTWAPSRAVLAPGDWLAIHASVSLFVGARRIVDRWKDTADAAWGEGRGLWPDSPPLAKMPRDAIIGVLRYAGSIGGYTQWQQGDRWAEEYGHYWTFSDRRPFATPIKPPPAGPMAHAGLWVAPPEVVEAARALGCEVPDV